MIKRLAAAATLLAVSAAPAFAHLDPAEHGSLMAGVSHPLFGARPHPRDGGGRPLGRVACAKERRPARVLAGASSLRRRDGARLRRRAVPPATALRRAGHPRLGRRHRPAGRGRAQRARPASPWRWSASSPSSTAMRMAANSARPARSPSASASRSPPRSSMPPALGLVLGSAALRRRGRPSRHTACRRRHRAWRALAGRAEHRQQS